MLNYFSFLGNIDNFFKKNGKSPAEEKLNTPTNPDFLKLEFDNKIIFQLFFYFVHLYIGNETE